MIVLGLLRCGVMAAEDMNSSTNSSPKDERDSRIESAGSSEANMASIGDVVVCALAMRC